MSSERSSSTQTMNSDHDEYNSSISVDSRTCSSMVGAGGEQVKAKGSERAQVWVLSSFGRRSLNPNAFPKTHISHSVL